jgi:hypothetical protein
VVLVQKFGLCRLLRNGEGVANVGLILGICLHLGCAGGGRRIRSRWSQAPTKALVTRSHANLPRMGLQWW